MRIVLSRLVQYVLNYRAVISTAAAVAVLALTGCGAKKDAAAPPPQAMPVQVQVVKSVSIPDASEYLSQLKSRHSASINPQVEGQITKIFVKSGDHVKRGAPLISIDPLKQEAAVSGQEAARVSQEANVRQAKINLDRQKALYEAKVTPKQDLDNAQNAYDAGVAQLKSLADQVQAQKEELRYYTVSAPMDGVVGDVPVRSGDRVAVTTLLTTVDEQGPLEVYIYVPMERSGDLKVGLPVHLLAIDGTVIADTKLSFVSPEVDTETQTVLAKANVTNLKASFRVAQQVRAQVTWKRHDGPVIPILAVTRINGQAFAFVAQNDGKGAVAKQKLLKVGDTLGNDYVVLDGLKPGEHIIVSGTQFLQDGVPVMEQVVNADANPPSTSGVAASR